MKPNQLYEMDNAKVLLKTNPMIEPHLMNEMFARKFVRMLSAFNNNVHVTMTMPHLILDLLNTRCQVPHIVRCDQLYIFLRKCFTYALVI